jgi:hypothetical protein
LQAMIYSLLDEPKPFSITSGDGVRSTWSESDNYGVRSTWSESDNSENVGDTSRRNPKVIVLSMHWWPHGYLTLHHRSHLPAPVHILPLHSFFKNRQITYDAAKPLGNRALVLTQKLLSNPFEMSKLTRPLRRVRCYFSFPLITEPNAWG